MDTWGGSRGPNQGGGRGQGHDGRDITPKNGQAAQEKAPVGTVRPKEWGSQKRPIDPTWERPDETRGDKDTEVVAKWASKNRCQKKGGRRMWDWVC